MKKNYIKPQTKVIKISTMPLMAASLPERQKILIDDDEYGFEDGE